METFALYLIKSSVWLTGFFLIYVLFLRNERFFVLNRIYLVSGILVSILFPLFTWHYTVIFPVTPTAEVLEPQVVGATTVSEPFPIQNLLLYFYLTGALYLIFRLIKQTVAVWMVIRNSETHHFNSIKLIRTDRYPASFSFFSFVFVNPSIDETETNEILNHEQEHIRQQHWMDLLLFEILRTMHWFNPISWLYGRLIRQNHEYLADERALQRSSNPAIYRAALLNQMFGGPVISLANSFNYSLNKKRFNMMKQITYSPFRKLKLLLVLPLIAGVFYAFATPEYKFVQAEDSSNKEVNTTASDANIYATEPVAQTNPVVKTDLHQNQPKELVTQASQNNEKVVKGKVVKEDGSPLIGTSIVVSGSTIGTMPDDNGNFKLEMPDDSPIVFSFVGFETVKVKPDFEKEMVITMKPIIIGIDAVGNDASNSNPTEVQVTGYANDQKENSSDHPDTGVKIRSTGNSEMGNNPLIVKNGIISEELQLKDIDPKSIKSMIVLKGEEATKKWGEQGKNGVVELTTTDTPLYVVDGTIVKGKDIEDIDPNTFESIEVLKRETAIKVYGDQGKNGVVSIHLKKQKEVFVVVEEMPEYPGGVLALRSFVAATLKYPTVALENGIQGQVTVGFTVADNGSVTDAKIERKVDPSLDQEALRIVNSMPKWKPGTQRGMPVSVKYEMPINFTYPADYHPKNREKLKEKK